MDPGVSVAVGHIQVATWRDCQIRGTVERRTAPEDGIQGSAIIPGIRWRARRSHGHQQLASGGELSDGVVAVVDAIDRIVLSHGDPMSARGKDTFTPRRDE